MIPIFVTSNRPVLFPMPEEAPVTTIVFPSSRFDIAEAMFLRVIYDVKVVCWNKGFGPKAAFTAG